MSITGRDICQDALFELQVLQAGETMGGDDANFLIGKLKRIFDNWNADRNAVYAAQIFTGTLTPSLSPHTIGPTGTFVVSQRPESVDRANLIFNTTLNPQTPIIVRDAVWYFGLSVPTLTTSVPTDLYYQPDWPNGKLYFYPVPNTAYQIELLLRVVLSQLELTDTFTLPPGYQDAATLTLAEQAAGSYVKGGADPDLVRRALEARARIFSNHVTTPHLATADSGMPNSQRKARGTYLNGWNLGR